MSASGIGVIPIILNGEQFGYFFTHFNKSATRIETLPVYSVEEEKDNLALYLSGAPLPPNRNEEWAANIRSLVAAGKYMGRVHIIEHSLNPYLQFEVDWYYAINGAAGEDIRFIFREDVPAVKYTDTWLFDEKTVIDLSYDDEGHLLYINRNDDSRRLKEAMLAWQEFKRLSFPFAELRAMVRSNNLTLPAH